MTGIDRSPTRPGSAVALVAALAALVAVGAFSWSALAFGIVGVVGLVAGIGLARHDAVTTACAVLFLAVLTAGIRGAPPVALLAGAVAAVVAWDSAGTAIDLGAQLGRGAPTLRLELVHAGGTALVGALAAGVGWAVFQIGFGTVPVTTPALLLVAALAVLGVLAYRDG